ncbi:MAG: peptidylprolyl isomerase [bacterium]
MTNTLMTQAARTLRVVLAALVLVALGMAPAMAQQDGFAPAAYVNSRVISQYELRQRILFMSLLHQPGDIPKVAINSLIDDAIRRDAAKKLDVTVSPEQITAGMAEFASRAKLSTEEFVAALGKGGVEAETLRDFIEAGLLWRAVIRTKYGNSTTITDAEIDRAIDGGAAAGGEMRVLLSEIVLPTGGTVDALALAKRLKLTATTGQSFGMAAQNYSKAPSAKAGGALGWIPVASLPPEVSAKVLALKVGEVTDPISVTGAVELFYLRDLSLAPGDGTGPTVMQVDYAEYFAPAGTDLAAVKASLDSCDDLYDAAKGLPPEAVQRATVAEMAVPVALRLTLAGLDPGEAAVVTAPTGVPALLMLCDRTPMTDIPPSRDDVSSNLLNKRLGLLAGAYLEELRSNAIIRIQ